MSYKIIADNGKPYEIIAQDKECLFNELFKLEQEQEKYAYMDIVVLNSKGVNITDKIFRQYSFKKERVGFLK